MVINKSDTIRYFIFAIPNLHLYHVNAAIHYIPYIILYPHIYAIHRYT